MYRKKTGGKKTREKRQKKERKYGKEKKKKQNLYLHMETRKYYIGVISYATDCCLFFIVLNKQLCLDHNDITIYVVIFYI
jgi:nickel-dependent lactate racemase